MKEVNIKIGEKKYKVKLATTGEEQEKGLQEVENLDNDKGMLFVFEKPDEISFWMKNTVLELDIIFIDEDMNVISIHKGEPKSEELITEQNVMYVLEVNLGSGIKIGDELEFSSENKVRSDKMHVLDADGNTQMELDGGERIFSRKHTKTLIKFAKKASITHNDNDYRQLGKRVFKFLEEQNNNTPEYVENKK